MTENNFRSVALVMSGLDKRSFISWCVFFLLWYRQGYRPRYVHCALLATHSEQHNLWLEYSIEGLNLGLVKYVDGRWDYYEIGGSTRVGVGYQELLELKIHHRVTGVSYLFARFIAKLTLLDILTLLRSDYQLPCCTSFVQRFAAVYMNSTRDCTSLYTPDELHASWCADADK